uniref:Uncharacterized protein n=1 Tax=Cacopsylla melanoneura TaxID=428564 RepID=A0A8D8XGH8_9HEMI
MLKLKTNTNRSPELVVKPMYKEYLPDNLYNTNLSPGMMVKPIYKQYTYQTIFTKPIDHQGRWLNQSTMSLLASLAGQEFRCVLFIGEIRRQRGQLGEYIRCVLFIGVFRRQRGRQLGETLMFIRWRCSAKQYSIEPLGSRSFISSKSFEKERTIGEKIA